MDGKNLYAYYDNVLLPQFGLIHVKTCWERSDILAKDMAAHYFSVEQNNYVLIFEDFGNKASSRAFIKANIATKNDDFEYIEPISHTQYSPSYGAMFPIPFQYCMNVTGIFTLVKL